MPSAGDRVPAPDVATRQVGAVGRDNGWLNSMCLVVIDRVIWACSGNVDRTIKVLCQPSATGAPPT